MRFTSYGAAGGEVTGSAFLVETSSARLLIDCGLFQGSRDTEEMNEVPLGETFGKLDAVLITHAHLDHTGRLPLLAKGGYAGPVYATPATIEVTELILKDSARLQRGDAERENRRRQKKGKPPIEPLYDEDDVEKVRSLFREVPYEEAMKVAPGVRVRAVEAGHILGSASLELAIEENGRTRTVVFSGDLGPRGAPLHKDPVPFKKADIVFLESTYGDRTHRSLADSAVEAREAIAEAIAKGGKVLVPTFAIGRAQVLLYLLAGAFQRKTLKPFPIYLDSPMAIEATKIYARHNELFDDEALAMQKSGDLRKNLEMLQLCQSADESRKLNDVKGCLILAGSGMCTGGRILHHLRHNLANPSTLVLFVGFQAYGSLGRRIVDRSGTVTIFGEAIPVNASVCTLGGLSGHADQPDLLNWIASVAPSKPRLFVVHGEEKARRALGGLAAERFQLNVAYPTIGQTINIE